MRVDDFGVSLVFDQATGFILAHTKSNTAAHFISSCILDTATYVFVNAEKRIIDFPRAILGGKVRIENGLLQKADGPLSPALEEKRQLAELLRTGYSLLLSQAYILESSFDGFDFLSTTDLPMYLQNKELFVQMYQQIHSVSREVAEKHLDFLADNLLQLVIRRKQLIEQHGATLRRVTTQDELLRWSGRVMNEFVTLGTV